MRTKDFLDFIKKYHLSGLVEGVRWEFSSGTLSTRFYLPDGPLSGIVSMPRVDIQSQEIGIHDTSKLLQMVSVLDGDNYDDKISIDIISNQSKGSSLELESDMVRVRYMLPDIDAIPKIPKLKQLPQFDAAIRLTGDFKNAFVSSYRTLSKDSTFTFIYENGKGKIIVGDYHNSSVNRFIIEVDSVSNVYDKPVAFSAEHLHHIILANNNFYNNRLSISYSGLASVIFDAGGVKSIYHLEAIQK